MKLVKVKLKNKTDSQPFICIIIGTSGDKSIILKSSFLSKEEASIIILNKSMLLLLETNDRINWILTNVRSAREAYRTPFTDNLVIVEEYVIK